MLGMSRKDLQKRLGISRSSVECYELGYHSGSRMSKVLKRKFAKALKTTVEEINRHIKPRKFRASPSTKLGMFIRQRRLALGMFSKDLAKKVGLGASVIVHYELAGNHIDGSMMSLKLRRKFAKALKCSLKEFEALLPKRRRYFRKVYDPGTLSSLLYNRRVRLNIDQQEIISMHGISGYSKFESGKSKAISLSQAKILSKMMGIPIKKFHPFIRYPHTKNLTANESSLGGFIREKRMGLHMSQQELADKIGVTRASVSLMEIGNELKGHNPKRLSALAKALKVNMAELTSLVVYTDIRNPYSVIPRKADTLGEFVTMERQKLRLTQIAFANLCGLPAYSISPLERNELKVTNLIISKLTAGLGCEIPENFFPDIDGIGLDVAI